MASITKFKFRLSGDSVLPGAVRSKDLAEIIASVELMIATLVAQDNSNIKRDDVVVGLSDVEDGSLILVFDTNYQPETSLAIKKITSAVNRDDYEDLPTPTVEGLQALQKFAKKVNGVAEIIAANGHDTHLATITRDQDIYKVPVLSGETTLYGEVIRVGGKKDPKVAILTYAGDVITCEITQDTATRLGRKLYQPIGLKGTAKWNTVTWKVEEFKVEEVIDYEPVDPRIAFKELADDVGDAYGKIEDIDLYFETLRHGEDEE